MALFKIFGNFASGNTTLPTSTTQGYCYFDKNTGKFYIDTATSETAELGTNRLALNADKADKDGAGNSIINTYLTKANGLTNVSLNTSTRKLQKTINGTTSDITQLGLIPGTGENSVIGGGTSSDISTATGKCAMAYGRNASASGNYSFAFGYNAQAKGLYSVAMGGTISGQDTIAIGAASLAVGGGVQTGNSTDAGNASGNYAVAVGYHSKAIGNISFASGYGTISKGQSAASFGAWNLIDNTVTTDNAKGTYAFAVGNGTADDARSNALTVDWSGNTTIAGSLTLNGTTTITATDISNWNNSSVVSISPTLTSGTKIGTITIDGTSTDLYGETNTDTKVTQNAAITTSGAYPILLGNSTATTAITDTVNKTSTLTYNPSTQNLNVPSIETEQIFFNQELEITNGHCILHLNEEIDQDTHRNKFVYEGNQCISMIDLNESFATIETNPYNGQNPGAYMCVYTDEVKAGLQDNSGGHLKIGSYGVSLIYGDPDSSSPHSYIRVTDDPIVEIESTLGIDLRAPNIYMSEDSQVKITKLSLPNASNSNTYSSGTAGQVLTTNGTNVYWGAPAATVTESTISDWGFTKNAGTITGATTNGGLTVTGSTLGHSNTAITAKTTAGVYPVKIDELGHITEAGTAIISSDATDGGTTLSLVTTGEKYTWNNKSSVSITPALTSGTKIGTITIDGTSTDLYSETNTDTKVTQNAVITTAGEYPVILANSTATTAITDTVNKTSTLTYNPNTQILTSPKVSADNIYVGTASYGDTLPTTGTTGQIFFVEDNEEQGETVTTADISNWNNKSTVSITPNLTSGTKIGTITIDGTSTDLYSETNTDTKTRQTLYSSNYNLPLLMSYQNITNTTTDVDNITYRNNSIYANPSTGTITTPNETITNKLTINTLVGNSATYGDTLPATGVEGQIFFKKLSSS